MRDKRPANSKDITDTLVIGSRTLTSIEFETLPGLDSLLGFGGFGGFERLGGLGSLGGLGGFSFLFLVTSFPSLFKFNFRGVNC
jgi:hypothetical protein